MPDRRAPRRQLAVLTAITPSLAEQGRCAIPHHDLLSRYDTQSIVAIRKRLRTAGLPMRAVHVLIRLGFQWPDEVRAALLEDEPGGSGVRAELMNARNCGRRTIVCVETWLRPPDQGSGGRG
jgi:hypothetical protein